MARQSIKRQVAHKVWINVIVNSNYVKQEGWDPNYIEVDGKQISRVNLVATVVGKFLSDDGNYGALTLDDSTDTIRCKAFGPDVARLKDANIGDVVRFIGKVREYNEEIHLSPEVVKVIDDKNWLLAWKMELGEPKVIDAPARPASTAALKETGTQASLDQPKEEKPSQPEENFSANVLKIIKDLDKGDGAKTEAIIEASKLEVDEAKNVIAGLLKSGDIFEPKKGILKVLD